MVYINQNVGGYVCLKYVIERVSLVPCGDCGIYNILNENTKSITRVTKALCGIYFAAFGLSNVQ